MDRYARCGSPRSRSKARIRSRPNFSGHGESASSQLTGESVELTAVPRQLLTLGGDDVLGSIRHETVVGEHPLSPGDLLPEPLDLGGRVAIRLLPLRFHDGLEDASLLAVELDAHAAPA